KFTPEEIAPGFRPPPRRKVMAAEPAEETTPAQDIGSNNWIVSGRLTRSGKPMMMNDPHRTQAAPSLRYWVHLVAPGWNVLRAAWMEIGSAPYLASLRMDQAASWEEFREACTYGRIPSENMVWAGVDGTIGYQAAGIAPRRPNWSGLLPVPGDGRYEWNGYL